MKYGRLILTHRNDLINSLREYYLTSKRTDFLVITYNKDTVDPSAFTTSENFKFIPYFGDEKREVNHINGQQFHAWVTAVKAFPEITHWVIHDYDFICKSTDSDLFLHVRDNEYGMIGDPIPVWQKGMTEAGVRMFPFPVQHKEWNWPTEETGAKEVANINQVLMEAFPYTFQGISTLLGGYSDLIVTTRENILLLDDPVLKKIPKGGGEQVPQTVFNAHNISSVDLSGFYKSKLVYDNSYSTIDEPFEFIHPVKFWPEGIQPSLKVRLKNIVKKIIILFFPEKISYS
jgi:hypothetical protein